MKRYIAALLLILLILFAARPLFSSDIPELDLDSLANIKLPEPTQPKPIEPKPTETEAVQPTQTEEATEPTPEPAQPLPEGSVMVSYEPETVDPGNTFTGIDPLDCVSFIVPDAENTRRLSNEQTDFSFGAAKGGEPHWITVDNQELFDRLNVNTLAWDNKTGRKYLYLTFDCGYEYENLTSEILDILNDKNVPAAFFCTLSYLKEAPDVVTRMIREGYTVGNHSTTHPNCTKLTREQMAWEILGVENYLRVNFGYSSRYFRFPSGQYSPNMLDVADSVGQRTVFWSIAHADWDPENQPGVQKTYNTITSRLHPGAVILLHTTSPDNVAVLADFIDYARDQGYEFRTLDDYPFWKE